MKTKLRNVVCCILLQLGCAPFVSAQGTSFAYQGRLDTGGSPANGIFDLQFAIFDAASGGAPLAGPLINSATAVSNGRFTVAPGLATISWSPATGTNWILQERLSLSAGSWTNSPSGWTNPIVVPATLPTKFYRLFKP